jgi:polar amino acid transport system substrate-binding protein
MNTQMNMPWRRVANIRFGIVLVGALAMILSLTTLAKALTPDQIKANGKLVVGVLTDFPPFDGLDANHEPAGYDVDVAKLMAASLGVKLQLVPVTGPNRIPYLLTNRIDMLIASLGYTPQRAEQVLISNPYSTLGILVMAPKNLEIKGPKDLAKYTVGVTRAGSQDTLVSAVAPPGTVIKRYDDDALSIQAMIARQVQVLGGSAIHLAVLNRDHPEMLIEEKFPLHEQGNGVGLRKGDTELLAWTNAFIAEIVASGELNEIHQRWLGSPLGTLPSLPKP